MPKKRNNLILGISEEHDAGIALLLDGKLLWAANEERYSRKKFQTGMPVGALSQLSSFLNEKRIPFPGAIAVASHFHIGNDLGDWIALDWKYELLEQLFSATGLDRVLWGSLVGPQLLKGLGALQKSFRIKRFTNEFSKYGGGDHTFYFVDHHTAHAAAAYYTSGWEDCLVITQDASGDGYCSKVFVGHGGKIEEKHGVPFFHSPGHYYEYVTLMFGFKIGREGKVTGLAAAGDPTETYPIFLEEMSYDTLTSAYKNHALYRKPEMNRLKKKLSSFSREDIAAGVQKHLETMMTRYVTDMITRYAPNRPVKLAVTGGVFANVKLNQRIAALSGVSQLFVYPHMGDGGLSAGAAFYVWGERGKAPYKLPHVYLGDTPGVSDIKDTLALYRDNIVVDKPTDLVGAVVDHLSRGHVVAVVRGPMEYGPRALGHRTLLSQATDPTVNDWLNKRLKRSEFMPFAPILKVEDLPRYFDNWKKVTPSLPYMTVTVDCNKRCQKEAPAIVHVDNSARPQIVRKSVEPFMYKVLTAYAKKTGLRILINTSYNIHEEPIVRTADHAVKTFLDGHIDALVLGDYLITLPGKKRGATRLTKKK